MLLEGRPRRGVEGGSFTSIEGGDRRAPSLHATHVKSPWPPSVAFPTAVGLGLRLVFTLLDTGQWTVCRRCRRSMTAMWPR